MKSKFFFLFVLFMGIGVYTFAQAAADVSTTKKDSPRQEVSIDNSKSTVSSSSSMTAKSDCKWVDADKDGICDICGKKDCGKKETKATMNSKSPSDCPVKSSCGKKTCCSSKGGKKPE